MVSPTGAARRIASLSKRIAWRLWLWPCIAILVPPLAELGAQVPQDSNLPPADQILASYEGQKVIAVDIAGRPDLEASQFSSAIAQQGGQPFDSLKVNAVAAAVKAAGHFRNVRVQVEPDADGVRVSFVIEPAVYYGIFEFPGAERFPYSRLVQVANYQSQSPYDASKIERDRQLLVKFFEQEGYFTVQVTTELQVDQQHGIVNVLFHCNLGRPAKFGDIDIQGLPAPGSADLEHRLTTLLARLRGAAIRKGKSYHHSSLNNATKFIEARLQKEGFLSAQVKLAGAEYHADTNRADIHFNVKAGPKTTVEVAGAHLWPWTRKSLLPEYQGVGVDEETVQEGEQALVSYYQKKGYFDVKVTSEMKKGDDTRTVVYHVSREKKHTVTAVRMTGESGLKAAEPRAAHCRPKEASLIAR